MTPARALTVLVVLLGTLAAGLALLVPETPGPPVATVSVADVLGGAAGARFTRALSPRPFVFPGDHGPHPGYRTEWWYFSGNVATGTGRHFGYQLAFFRVALVPEPVARDSAWAATDVYMAHFAVTDTAGGRFHPSTRIVRGALGLAGARGRPFRVWAEDWWAGAAGGAGLPARLQATTPDVAIDLLVEPGKPVVLQGDRGLSRKGPEEGNASYYYSLTRMPTRGSLRVGATRFEVTGTSWMDREWSTSALGDAVGWDWFALQLDDGRDVMLYRLRRADGSASPFSAGTVVAGDGRPRRLGAADVQLETLGHWTSPRSGVRYPARWRLAIPSEALSLVVTPRLADQEFAAPVRYWEGAVVARSTDAARPVGGVGYVELVGYVGPGEEDRWTAGRR